MNTFNNCVHFATVQNVHCVHTYQQHVQLQLCANTH